MKIYDTWEELKQWLSDKEIEDVLFVYHVQDKIEELESKHE